MSFDLVKPDLVRFEMRMVQGQDPHTREQKKPGGFGRFLSGLGRILGGVMGPLSFLFPPAALGAAGMYGISALGDGMQAKAYGKAADKAQRESQTMVSFPGLQMGGGGLAPASFDLSSRDQDVMGVLGARAGSLKAMSRAI